MFHRHWKFLWLPLIGFPLIFAELKKDFECGTAKSIAKHCFNESSPDIMEFIETVKIDGSEEDILNRCT